MKKISIPLFLVIIFIMCLVGYLSFNKMRREKINAEKYKKYGNYSIENEVALNSVETASVNNQKIKPNASLKTTQKYKGCGHTIVENMIIPNEIVNMNEEEVKKYYFDWNVDKFSENGLEISKEIDIRCNQHYVVKECDGVVSVYYKDENNHEHFVEYTDILTKYLSEDDLSRLKNGILVVGEEDLCRVLEDFE